MKKPICPFCEMPDVVNHGDHWECLTCGHEWTVDNVEPVEQIVKDAFGTVLAEGDSVTLIKDLKLKGGSQVLKGGTKVKNIRLVDGDHEISCKIDGAAMGLKACFVKKA